MLRTRATASQLVQAPRLEPGEVFRCNPYKIDGRYLFYAPSIGTDPGFADIIIEQAMSAKS